VKSLGLQLTESEATVQPFAKRTYFNFHCPLNVKLHPAATWFNLA